MTRHAGVYAPKDMHSLVVTLLDPLGRKAGFFGRTIQIPEWAETTPLKIVGPPANFPALVIMHSAAAQFESVTGNTELRLV